MQTLRQDLQDGQDGLSDSRRQGVDRVRLQFSFEGAVEDGGEQGVQFGGGLELRSLQRVHLCLQSIQLGHNLALIGTIAYIHFFF
jgi:hypothetical protein